jgi:flavin reductase (DIM6/NTAB) family NADH-FMN oxidoreductase RutF
MVVVTTVADNERAGCLVGFHSQSSIDPPRYAVWLSKANHTYGVARRAEMFAVHYLAERDHELARHFGGLTGDEVDKFAGVAVTDGPDGLPVLDDCAHRIIGRRVTFVDEGGDHACVTLEPIEVHGDGRFSPFRLSDASSIDPGHPADD